jgi:copper(I)-binding protein
MSSNVRKTFAALLVSLLVLSTYSIVNASAHEIQSGSILIVHPWTKPTTQQNGPIFMRVVNSGGPTAIVSATTPRADRAGLMVGVGELSKNLSVGAADQLLMEPGGRHVMAISLDGSLNDGEAFPLSLTFEDGTVIELEVIVEVVPSHQ